VTINSVDRLEHKLHLSTMYIMHVLKKYAFKPIILIACQISLNDYFIVYFSVGYKVNSTFCQLVGIDMFERKLKPTLHNFFEANRAMKAASDQ
jgi:hypothetical protein